MRRNERESAQKQPRPDEGANARALLVIDQAPLLGAALDDCQSAWRSFEQLRAALERHETRDLPAFDRWHRQVFEALIAEAAELVSKAREKELALASLRKRHWDGFFDLPSCELHGVWQGEDNEPVEEEEEEPGAELRAKVRGAFRGRGFGFVEEGEDGFGREEYVYEEGGGGDEDAEESWFDDPDADGASREFYVRGGERRAGGYRSRVRPSEEEDSRRSAPKFARMGADGAYESGRASAGRGETARLRVKELYRLLVRKLHPDLNPDLSPEKKKLWNQVQAAYRDRSVERLQLLLALADALAGRISEATSLSGLRRAAEEIRASLGALREKVRAARAHRAWNFLALDDRTELKRETERELVRATHALRRRIDELDLQLLRFSRFRGTVEGEGAFPYG
jgi:hypothetical protein